VLTPEAHMDTKRRGTQHRKKIRRPFHGGRGKDDTQLVRKRKSLKPGENRPESTGNRRTWGDRVGGLGEN